jgi:hypothetical protein
LITFFIFLEKFFFILTGSGWFGSTQSHDDQKPNQPETLAGWVGFQPKIFRVAMRRVKKKYDLILMIGLFGLSVLTNIPNF